MLKLISFPWLSLVLVVLTYGVFGWYVSQSSMDWSHTLIEYEKEWGWTLQEDTIFILLHVFALMTILGVTLVLTAPIAFVSGIFKTWLKSDLRSVFFILLSSFAVVVILCWLEYFVRLLVILSATILYRFELQEIGYNKWQSLIFVILVGLCGFGLGVFMFTHWEMRA